MCAEITASVYSNRPLLQTKHGTPLLRSGTSRTEVGSHPAAVAYGNGPAHMWDLQPPRRFLQDNHMHFYTPLLSVKCPVATVLRYGTGGLQSPPGLFSSSLCHCHMLDFHGNLNKRVLHGFLPLFQSLLHLTEPSFEGQLWRNLFPRNREACCSDEESFS